SAGGRVASGANHRRTSKANPLFRVCGWKAGSATESSLRGASAVLPTTVRGILATDVVELVHCVHERVQGTRSNPSVQSDCEIGRILRCPLLVLVLAPGWCRPGRKPFKNRQSLRSVPPAASTRPLL